MNELKRKINDRQVALLLCFVYGKEYPISSITLFISSIQNSVSLATLKRDLTELTQLNYIQKNGEKRTLIYSLSSYGLLHRPYNLDVYGKDEQKNNGMTRYHFPLFSILEKEAIFSEEELLSLSNATKEYKEKAKESSPLIQKKELERFIIELSWKSSKIEGNTYTLLDTEKLLKEGIASSSHTKDEATMIVNHKKAFEYIVASIGAGKSVISFRELENIHRLLVDSLGVNHGLRRGAVGITGSVYLPIDVNQTLEEETKKCIDVIKVKNNFFEKALIAILCTSYLQPFEDGNKRTSRLFGNGILLEGGYAPLSYRSVDEKKYREAMLVFYEQNSIEAFKKIFIEQYIFACQNYNIAS